jgi:hypothetical protein
MHSEGKAEKEVILEPYLSEINEILKTMVFHTFENNKPYSFDYHLKNKFDNITKKIDLALKQNPKAIISPSITNKLPIFLPVQTSRIAFFSYQSKSVRAVNINELETILTKQAEKQYRAGEFPYSEISTHVEKDLKIFDTYHKKHNHDAYRRDISTSTIQFNAYDKDDMLLIEKSFVRGGLIFDMSPKEFDQKITVTYPRHRKQRSDKKNDYLPLKLLKIRGINLP